MAQTTTMGKVWIVNSVLGIGDYKDPDHTTFSKYVSLAYPWGYFLFIQRWEKAFYFICYDIDYFQQLCQERNWYIFYQTKDSHPWYMGIGITDDQRVEAEISCVPHDGLYFAWKQQLLKTFEGSFMADAYFFSFESNLSYFPIGDDYGFYLHKYLPNSLKKGYTKNDSFYRYKAHSGLLFYESSPNVNRIAY